jgi:hypothetical protein
MTRGMNTPVSIFLVILIVGGLVLDHFMGWGAALFLLRKFADLVEYLAFWR